MTGKAPRSKAKQPSEIIPPDKTDDTTDADAASSGATSKAGAHLRMPTFIDAEGNWRAMVSGFFGDRLARGLGAGRRFVGGLVYRTTLLLLLVTALGVTGFGIWQARNMSLPQFDSFWYKVDTPQPALLRADNNDAALDGLDFATPKTATGNIEGSDIERGNIMSLDAASIDGSDVAFEPVGDLADLRRQLQALEATSSPSSSPSSSGALLANTKTDDNLNNAANQALAAEQAAHAATRARLAALQRDHAALMAAQVDLDAKTTADEKLTSRAALAELLLRLDSGAAFDDLFEDGALGRVLRRSEWALLALYADSGVPTRAALLARLELWVANTNLANAGLADARARDSAFLAVVLDWLRVRADGLVNVRTAPLAIAGNDIERIGAALSRGQTDEAAWRMGALLRRLETDRGISHPDRSGLQLLYDDTRAAAELSPMLATLREDYTSGVRP